MKPTLYILCGVPGCGKSFYAENFRHDGVTISRDRIRFGLLNDGEDYFSKEDQVFNRFITMIHGNLKRGVPVMADATHLNAISRRKLIKGIDRCGFIEYNIVFIYFNTPFEVCCGRNNKRDGLKRVPQNVMDSMYQNFQKPSMTEDKRCIGLWLMRGV